MTIDEVEAFRAAAKDAPEWALFFDLTIYHFLTYSQISNLEVESLCLADGRLQLHIPDSGLEAPIPVAPTLVNALRRVRDVARSSGRRYLFPELMRRDEAAERSLAEIAGRAGLASPCRLQPLELNTRAIRCVHASHFQLLTILEHGGIRYLFNDYSLGGAMHLQSSSLVMLGLQRGLRILEPLSGGFKRILVIGGGAFAAPRYLSQECKASTIDVCEVDPVVCDLARKYFALEPSPPFKIFIADAFEFLRETKNHYDLIYIDVRLGSTLSLGASQDATELLDRTLRILQPGGVLIYEQPPHGISWNLDRSSPAHSVQRSAQINIFETDPSLKSQLTVCVIGGDKLRLDALSSSAHAAAEQLSLRCHVNLS